MKHINEQDVTRLKELLHRTGEFIAYFEVSEAKMIEWRQDIEHQAAVQQKQFEQQSHFLQNELNSLQEILTQLELTRFQSTTENTLNQGKEYLLAVKKTEQQLMRQMNHHQRELTTLTQHAIAQIIQHGSNTVALIEEKLSQYDLLRSSRSTTETCEQIEQSTQTAFLNNRKLLHSFHWHSIALALFTTLISAFSIGLYISDEYPWEVHQQVQNERGAGKMLMNAWSTLSQQERAKILSAKTYESS